MHAIYTGIDVSKRELAETIKSLATGLTDPAVHLGMEATNAYWYHAEQLLRRQLVGLAPRIYVLNPAVIRGFERSYTALPKTDAVDAWVIADRLHFGRPSPLGHCHRVRRPQADDPISLSAVHHPAERKAKGSSGPDLSESSGVSLPPSRLLLCSATSVAGSIISVSAISPGLKCSNARPCRMLKMPKGASSL